MNPDVALFKLINDAWGFDALAPFMKVMSNLTYFLPAILLFSIWMVLRGGLRGRVTVLALLLCIPLTDQVSSHVLKPLFGRPRPCRAESGILNVKMHGVGCSDRGSFPSSHAANIAGAATVLALRHRIAAVPAAAIAFLVGYSRVYLGVHYPLDVLGGWMLGGSLGWGVAFLGARGESRWQRRKTNPTDREPGATDSSVDTNESRH